MIPGVLMGSRRISSINSTSPVLSHEVALLTGVEWTEQGPATPQGDQTDVTGSTSANKTPSPDPPTRCYHHCDHIITILAIIAIITISAIIIVVVASKVLVLLLLLSIIIIISSSSIIIVVVAVVLVIVVVAVVIVMIVREPSMT